MEVHHHSHIPTSREKKWAHYFWEFLMLFLAVFCGFLAEYQLEHKIEKDRSKQYIRSFYNDLYVNLASLSKVHANNEKKTAVYSDIFSCYDTLSKNISNTACLALMAKHSMFFLTVAFADGTLGQLKNAGGLRLLNREDRDSVISYDNYTRNYRDWESTAMQHSQDNVRNTFDELGHFLANKFLYNDSSSADNIQVFLSADKNSVNKMFNVLFRYRQQIIRQNKWMSDIEEKTNALIKYFNSKYNFQ